MNQHHDALIDSAKPAAPIIGGWFMQWIHVHDAQTTELGHFLGVVSIVVGLIWYGVKFYRLGKKED
jgi:hypothetical protein